MNWNSLDIVPGAPSGKFIDLVVTPLRRMASSTIDEGAIFGGIFLPGSISDHIAECYDKHLFNGRTLQDLPDDKLLGKPAPRFVINATNVQSGVLMRFSRPYMRDFRVGQIKAPSLPLAKAVAASSAFPPLLSPCEIDVSEYGLRFEPSDGTEDLCLPPYTTKLVLSDGGVYDNLGLETVWNCCQTVLVSDAGAPFDAGATVETDWVKQTLRALSIATDQSRGLRKRALIADFTNKARGGGYWGIATDIANYHLSDALPCNDALAKPLATIRTRLNPFSDVEQEQLINWGYALCDAAVRAHAPEIIGVQKAPAWPCPAHPLS